MAKEINSDPCIVSTNYQSWSIYVYMYGWLKRDN